MAWRRNLLNHPKGIWRSLGGAADEQGFIAKATGAGFYIFFKVWRDMPYDAVLDYKGTLFRIEVKGTTTQSLDLTRGGRTGLQISRSVASRMRPISQNDCDFVVGVRGADNTCYVIPTEVVEILATGKTTGGLKIPISYLEAHFKERWNLFTGGKLGVPFAEILSGFRKITPIQRQTYLSQLNVPVPVPVPYRVGKTRRNILSPDEVEALLIWEHLGA